MNDLRRIVAPRRVAALCASLAVTLGAFSAGAQGSRDVLAASIETALVEEGLVGAIAGLLQWYAVLAAWGLAPLVLWR